MQIQEAAVKIVSAWEHGGHYTCHGNGAYGLIGWEGGQLVDLLNAYQLAGGDLARYGANNPRWLAENILVKECAESLDAVAGTELMQRVQQQQAYAYMTSAIVFQQKIYPFKLPLSQLVLCDMAVNNGLWNNYVKHCGFKSDDFERQIIIKAQKYRIQAVKDAGQWDKYEGIRRRYNWYLQATMHAPGMNMEGFLPSVMVNGIEVKLVDDHREPIVPL